MDEFLFNLAPSNPRHASPVVRVFIIGLYNPIENKQGYYWCCPAEPHMREIESEEALFNTKQAAQALAKRKGWVLLERICQSSE